MSQKTCPWTRIPDDAEVYAGQYESTCGALEHLWDSHWEFCPYCGSKLILKEEE